jgi:hypothetical protein
VHTEGNQAPTKSDSVRYYLAVILIVTYFPSGFAAITYLGPFGFFAVFLLYGVATLTIRCAGCSWPVFKRTLLWTPWPWRSCPKCSRPLIGLSSAHGPTA